MTAGAMKRVSAGFLQGLIILIGLAVLGLMLWEPHLEGRNVGATPFEIYFNDPFLAFAYVASIPFFVGVFQAFKVAGYTGRDQLFSPDAVKAMRLIKFCALAMIGFVVIAEIIILNNNTSDDRAGGVMIGAAIGLGSIIVAASAAGIEQALRKRTPVSG